jgi:RNA polymerase sigma-70 factor (ECF subfamily)
MTAMRVMASSRLSAGPGPRGRPAALPSFGAIYKDYFDFVWRNARRLGVVEDSIADIVQEVFLVVYARVHTLERPESLRSWLYSVVRRTVSMYHRERHTRSARESSTPVPDSASPMQPSPLDLALFNDELKLLWSLLGRLDSPKREILVLAELEEMTVPEIAQAIGIPLNTAYSRLRAARQEFNAAFARSTAQQNMRRRDG